MPETPAELLNRRISPFLDSAGQLLKTRWLLPSGGILGFGMREKLVVRESLVDVISWAGGRVFIRLIRDILAPR